MEKETLQDLVLIGGGPAALFMLKHIVLNNMHFQNIFIFEKNERLGVGMPYGKHGSCREHVANVSANELPKLVDDVETFLSKYPTSEFPEYFADKKVNPYQVLPRLLLGNYLENQFNQLIKILQKTETKVHVYTNTAVQNLIRQDEKNRFSVVTDTGEMYTADVAVICTGHSWPKVYEEKTEGWYDSPYPPSKFKSTTNYPVAVKGASLTAIDAVKTISRLNGTYTKEDDGTVKYTLNKDSENFSISLFSLGGYLPALRFHSEDEAYSSGWSMSLDEIYAYKNNHNGFVDLDYVFDKNFKMPLQKKKPEFYNSIKDMTIETFVDEMMKIRKELDSFTLFKAEYAEAEKSIRRKQSVSWKETLSAFSYAMNYPAKHFSAEDMIRLRKTLMPLISVIIASLPQSSYRELIALYDAGIIELIAVDAESTVEPHPEAGAVYRYTDQSGRKHTKHYRLYIDGIGQQPMEFNDIPFEGLKDKGSVSTGYLSFRNSEEGEKMLREGNPLVKQGSNQNFYLQVKGLSINDHFQALDAYGKATDHLFVMSVPFIGGLNPDYSGLDFCDTASERIIQFLKQNPSELKKPA